MTPSLRPNQVLAISLPYAVLHQEKWRPVLKVVREQLAHSRGPAHPRSGDPNYKPLYDGDLRARDAAYHQGTVWAWLIGPFFDAWLRAYPDDWQTARDLLAGFDAEMGEAGIGTISEIFDAEPPFKPRGCIAQAWSVAEVLRCELKLRAGRAGCEKTRGSDERDATGCVDRSMGGECLARGRDRRVHIRGGVRGSQECRFELRGRQPDALVEHRLVELREGRGVGLRALGRNSGPGRR